MAEPRMTDWSHHGYCKGGVTLQEVRTQLVFLISCSLKPNILKLVIIQTDCLQFLSFDYPA